MSFPLTKKGCETLAAIQSNIANTILSLEKQHSGIVNYFIFHYLRGLHVDDYYKSYFKNDKNEAFDKSIYEALALKTEDTERSDVVKTVMHKHKDIPNPQDQILYEHILYLQQKLEIALKTKMNSDQVALNSAIKELEDHAQTIERQTQSHEVPKNNKGKTLYPVTYALRKTSDELFIAIKDRKGPELQKILGKYNKNFSEILALAFEDKILWRHRGNKRLIGNILLCLTGIGIFLAIADIAYSVKNNGKSLLWNTRTESLLKQVEQAATRSAPAA